MLKEEPKGIPFFSIKSGDTYYARSSAQIQAMINSSDMGINASRGQDFGWRLAPDWVKKVKAFRNDPAKTERLSEKHGGADPTTPQILYSIYSEMVRAYNQRQAQEENPFEGEYLQKISTPEPAMAKVTEDPKTTNEVEVKTASKPKTNQSK